MFISQGKDEFLGRARAEPVVRTNGSEGGPARLAWYTIEKDDSYGGDILAAFELFLVSQMNYCSMKRVILRMVLLYPFHFTCVFATGLRKAYQQVVTHIFIL